MVGIMSATICIGFFLVTLGLSTAQDSNSCSEYFRSVHRRGLNVVGRLEIPTDSLYPKYKLRIGFNSPVHHMTIRQFRAKDSGTHREFIVDPMEMQRDGRLHLDVFIRLQRMRRMPRLTRIVYNNHAVCGDPLDASDFDESVAVTLTTNATTARPTVPIIIPSNNTKRNPDKDYEDEDDLF